MVPKLHKKGTSFKGAAAYLLHDKERAQSAERVEWIAVRNLATDDPELAWRIMAATSMDQDRLKAEAGVKNTGRKSAAHVLHYSLSWHPDEKDALSREEMMRAAHGSIRALGAEDRQAMIIAHNDEEQPHLHVLLNRVSPENGVILSSSKEKLKLSAWAEAYEKERGTVYCEERVVNNAARARGEFTRAAKEQPRHIYEAEQDARQAINDNEKMADRIRAEQKAKDAALAQRGRDMQAKHRRLWDELVVRHKARKQEITDQAERDTGAAKAAVRQDYRPAWRETLKQQREQLTAFDAREATWRGRAGNLIDSMKWTRQVRGEEQQRSTLKTYYALISSSGARRQALERAQAAEQQALRRQQAQEMQERAQPIEARQQAALADNRVRFMAERQDVLLQQRADEAKLRAEWRSRNEQRQQAMADLQRQAQAAPKVRPEFNQAAEQERRRAEEQEAQSKPPAQDPVQSPPKAESAPPDPQAERRAQMLRHLEESRQRAERDRDRER